MYIHIIIPGAGITEMVSFRLQVGHIRRSKGAESEYRTHEYQLRVGDYRARFELEKDIMRILRVRNRREAYR